MSLTLLAHNFAYTGPFSAKPVPIESPFKALSIGANFVLNQPLLTKVWTNKVGDT